MVRIGRYTVLVDDLDTAQTFYASAFGFTTLWDAEPAPGHRYVHVGPGGLTDPGLWLFQATSDEARTRVGDQTAGHPQLVLYSDDLDADLTRLADAGVHPHHGPLADDHGRYAHVRDPWGNEIVLAQLDES